MRSPSRESYYQARQNFIKQTKVSLVKVMHRVKYRDKNWIIKKADFQRVDATEMWCWRKLLRVPWTAKRSKGSIVKEISPEYCLEVLMLKL